MTTEERISNLEATVAALCENNSKLAANAVTLHEALTITAAGCIEAQGNKLDKLAALVGEILAALGARTKLAN
jgi:hypothetical protein